MMYTPMFCLCYLAQGALYHTHTHTHTHINTHRHTKHKTKYSSYYLDSHRMDHPVAKKPKLDECTAADVSNGSTSLEHSAISVEASHLVDEDKNKKPVQECDVGITEFISNHQGFQGIIKQR